MAVSFDKHRGIVTVSAQNPIGDVGRVRCRALFYVVMP